MAQEVVIVGADGREHVFPAGFDPQRAAAIVRQQAGGQPAPSDRTPRLVAGESTATAPTDRTSFGQLKNFGRDLVEQGKNVAGLVPPLLKGFRTITAGSPAERAQMGLDTFQLLKALPGAIKDDLVKSYGSWEAVQRTAYEEPARFAMDVAALGGVVGGLKNVARATASRTRAAGRGLMQSSLKITPEEAAQAGQGVAHRGAQALTERVGSTPGGRMKTKFRAVEKSLQDLGTQDAEVAQAASAAGVRIPGEPIVAAGEQLTLPGGRLYSSFESPEALSGARRTVEGVRQKMAGAGEPMSDAELVEAYQAAANRIRGGEAQGVGDDIVRNLPTGRAALEGFDPVELRQWLKNTEFVSGGDVPGSAEATRAMRTAGSEAYKEAVPGARDIFAQQSTQMPVREILDRTLLASGREASARSPHLMVRGSGAHTFGIIPLMKSGVFDVGNLLYKTGRAGEQALASQADPRLVRLAMLGLLRPEASHR